MVSNPPNPGAARQRTGFQPGVPVLRAQGLLPAPKEVLSAYTHSDFSAYRGPAGTAL